MITVDAAPHPLAAVVSAHADRLARAGVPSPSADAWSLAESAFGLPPARLRMARGDELPPAALERLAAMVERRAARVPLQHITGEVGFRELVLRCRPGVFVPRPETEVLAGLAVDAARGAARGRTGRVVVAEPCAGAGAVALSIASEVAGVRVHATDRSPAAVRLATENLAATPLRDGSTVEFRHGDLLEPLPASLRGAIDVLVSNPPYLTRGEVDAAEPEVRDHEPAAALVADRYPDEVIERLVEAGFGPRRWLRPGGLLLVEVSELRADRAAAIARRAGAEQVELVADLVGRERFLVARRADDR